MKVGDRTHCKGNLYPHIKNRVYRITEVLSETEIKLQNREEVFNPEDFTISSQEDLVISAPALKTKDTGNAKSNKEHRLSETQNLYTTDAYYKPHIEKYKDEHKIPTYKKGHEKIYSYSK